jgi:ABC-type sugar transport system ATPase subunit
MVYQELALTGGMSIAENILLNRQPTNRLKLIKKSEMNKTAQKYLDLFGIDVDPSTLIKRLPLGQHQIIEILKAVSLEPKVLILDEPTSSLTEADIARLFNLIEQLKEKGMSVIYISHKLSEIFKIADRVMVMRDGKHIATKSTNEVSECDLITMMVNRELNDLYAGYTKTENIGEEYFTVDNISATGLFKNVSFGLKQGEILGIAGLIGAGRTELASGIMGLEKLSAGTIYLNGKEIHTHSVQDAMDAGIGYVTEDRKKLGLFLSDTICANMIAPSLRNFSKNGFIQTAKIEKHTKDQIEEFNVATPSLQQKMLNLSGGNQQKCLLSMWMSKDPKVLIFDEPTRGVDVGAKSEIYQKIREYVANGNGAIVISSDLPELLGICDRLLIMYQGKIRGELQSNEFSEEKVMRLASGMTKADCF